MNRFTILITLLLISVSALNAQWIYVNPPETFLGGNYVVDHNGELYHANNQDIHKTTDEGTSWINLTQGFVTNPGNANYFIQFAGNNIFVATSVLAIFMSPDNGATWQMDSTGLEGSYQAAVLYTDGTNIYSGFDWPTYGFYMKAATAGPWMRINSGSIGTDFNTQVKGMTKINSTLYAATRNSGVFESTDNGATWLQKTNSGLISPVDGQFADRLLNLGSDLFVSTDNGIYKSTDQAESWTRVDQGFAVWDQFNVVQIWALYTDGSNLYASVAQDDSAYVSTDGGTTWSDISGGLNHRIKSFTMHNGKLFAAQWDTDSSLIRFDGTLDVEKEEGVIPQKFNLGQNYPNPFNPSTNIKFSIPQSSYVTLEVYNLVGERVGILVSEQLGAGTYNYDWNASNLTSGIYFYRIQAGNFIETKKMMLLK